MDKLINYFNGDELAADVWNNKYAITSTEGVKEEETPDDMHRRMAKEFAKADSIYEDNRESVKGLSNYGKERTWLNEDIIYEMFKNFKYIIPQGSIMSQLGNPYSIGSLSNCFVLGQPRDSYGGICQKDEEMVQLMKRRGGVGIDISSLRPSETEVRNSARSSTGAASFMHRYSNSTREVAQSGRRGALMLSIDIRHPDVMDFIMMKQDLTKVTGANVSVMIRDDFMQAVKSNEDYFLRFPCDKDINKEYLTNIRYNVNTKISHEDGSTIIVRRIKAVDYWKAVVECAWKSAEPGIMFIDRHWNYSPDGIYSEYKGVTTNPCSEIFMQEYDACRLIAKNMYSFVVNPFSDNAFIDYDLLYKMSYEQQWLGDLLVDLEINHINRIIKKIESDPEANDVKFRELLLWERVKKEAMSGRRTGSGPTGYGDMLAALNIKYDSDEALEVLDKVARTIFEGEWDASIDLSILRGPFTGWNSETEFTIDKNTSTLYGNNDFYKMMTEEFPHIVQRMMKYGRRNVSLSTAAPTGSVSLLSQVSSGIEPVWSVYHIRRKKINPNEKGVRVDFVDQNGDSWQEYPVLHPKFKDWWTVYRKTYVKNKDWEKTNGLVEYDLENMNKNNIDLVFKLSPWYKSTANDINWPRRVTIQGILQKYITHSISSTVNIPNNATIENVSEIYETAWGAGVKGITVYRDGCRTGVLVSDSEKVNEAKLSDNNAPKRPTSIDCKVVRFQNNYEKWVAFVGIIEGRPYEVFTGPLESFPVPNKVEEGSIVKTSHPTLGKSYDFHYTLDGEDFVIKGLSKAFNKEYWNYAKLISSMLRHGMPVFYVTQTIENMSFNEDHINLWKYGIVRALKKFIENGKILKIKCSECGENNIIFEEGCQRCLDCGSSKCG